MDVIADIDVDADANVVFKASADVKTVMILLTAEEREKYSITWRGGEFDTSLTPFIPRTFPGPV